MRNAFFGTLVIFATIADWVLAEKPQSLDVLPPSKISALPSISTGVLPESVATQCAPTPIWTQPSCGFGLGSGRFWGTAEFLLWRIKDANVPPLVTTGTETSLGILGEPGTAVLFGGGVDYGTRMGGRFTLGTGLGCDGTMGAELGYFFLGGGANRFGIGSSGAPGSLLLARPFINVIPDPAEQSAQNVAFPGLASGSVNISSSSNLQGADLNFFRNLCCQAARCPTDCYPADSRWFRGASFRVDLFGGPRWMQLNEDLNIAEQVTDLATGDAFSLSDRFNTSNNFYGGQIGARAELQRGRFFVNALGKVALGVTHQEVNINGSTVITPLNAAPTLQQGGLLALPTNIGSYNRDQFAVVPELNINLGFQVNNNIWVFAGYNFIYWSSVVRPGDQIDVGINPTQIPAAGPVGLVGPARPAFTFHDTDFWAHGINLGLQFRY